MPQPPRRRWQDPAPLPVPLVNDADLEDPRAAFAAFTSAARALDVWHATDKPGPRPPGQLRSYPTPQLSRFDRTWSRPLYHAVYDPDGRPRSQRGGDRF